MRKATHVPKPLREPAMRKILSFKAAAIEVGWVAYSDLNQRIGKCCNVGSVTNGNEGDFALLGTRTAVS